MKLKRLCLNTVIIAYLMMIYFSGAPSSNTLNDRLKNQFTKIALALGTWPSWSMFAPNTIKFDSKTYASYVLQDGQVIEEDIEPEISGVLAPFRRARWMKYSQDNIRLPGQSALLTPLAKYLKHKKEKEGFSIKSLKIVRRWEDVPYLNQDLPIIPLRQKIIRQKHESILFEDHSKGESDV